MTSNAELVNAATEHNELALSEIINIFVNHGNSETETLKSELDKHKNTPVNIAFIGQVKAGKSTVINSLRELYPRSPGAAGTAAEVCTEIPCPYEFSQHPNIILWDVPGVNVPSKNIEGTFMKLPCLTIQDYLNQIKNVKM